eukprot:3800383-Karenia_brevis.AAC.1
MTACSLDGRADVIQASDALLNVISFNTAMAAFAGDGQWQHASLTREARLTNVISFNAAMSACEKGQQWQRVATVFNELQSAALTLD